MSKHPSRPRNKNIAAIFFKGGFIESWGRGIERILTACKDAGMPEPFFEESCGGVQVTFYKSEVTETVVAPVFDKKTLLKLGLNDRQLKAVEFVTEFGKITNTIYQEINSVARNTASRDLRVLIVKNIFKQTGKKGAGSEYILIAP